MDRTIDRRIAHIAASQHGLVERRQALDHGLTPDGIRHRLETGRWQRARPGVYRIAGSRIDAEQVVLAACLHVGPAGAASLRSAAWSWGLDGFETAPSRPEVTVPGEATRRVAGVVLHRTATWTIRDRTTIGVTPVTTITRTLVDLGRVVPVRVVETARDSAHRMGLVSMAREAAELERLATLPGAGVLRSLVAADEGRPPAQSVLERTVFRHLRRLRVPEPLRQHRIEVGGRPIHFDAAWPDALVALEAHSYRHHSNRRHWSSDVTRLNAAGSRGWLVFVATEEELEDGGAVLAAEICGALELRRTLGA
jgi:hypothetical protein